MLSLFLKLSLTGADAAPVTMDSLLNELVSNDSRARWPEPPFKVRQASSYDRARIAPDQPGWFANNDSSNYIRTEKRDGHKELVMMDADGPGAIVRFFVTNNGNLDNHIRIYLDGAKTPTFDWPSSDLLQNGWNIGEPLMGQHPAPLGHGGSTLYLPIPYAHHCKVTFEEKDPSHPGGRYYHIDYRTYPAQTAVETMSLATLNQERGRIAAVNQMLSFPPPPPTDKTITAARELGPNQEATLNLPSGEQAVKQIEFYLADLPPAAREQALRSLVLRATFDGEKDAIWCPAGDFFGSGAGGRPIKSWYRDVDAHGHSVCRWTMPYRSGGKLTLKNLGTQKLQVALTAKTRRWVWDERSMYFHCDWRRQENIPSRPFRDWNFDTMDGRGTLVGDAMSVFNPIPSWYGEGNEKIWVDNESFPSHVGTGTEDYYNASWAPNPVFQTPFANHPRIDEPLSQGQNVYTRSRNLDVVPFDNKLKFDFEIETWQDGHVDYAATTYWYGSPGARSHLRPDPIEATSPLQTLPAPFVIQGALECETLPVVGKSPGLEVRPQDMSDFPGLWSAHSQLLIKARQVGDYAEIAIPATSPNPQRITLYATQANDYGIVRFSVNGIPVAAPFNGYAPNPTPSAPISLGVFTPVNRKFILRAEVTGADPRSSGFKYLAGLDAVVVTTR